MAIITPQTVRHRRAGKHSPDIPMPGTYTPKGLSDFLVVMDDWISPGVEDFVVVADTVIVGVW